MKDKDISEAEEHLNKILFGYGDEPGLFEKDGSSTNEEAEGDIFPVWDRLPTKVDLRESMPAVVDDGDIASSSASAVASAASAVASSGVSGITRDGKFFAYYNERSLPTVTAKLTRGHKPIDQNKRQLKFSDLKIGDVFEQGGTTYKKLKDEMDVSGNVEVIKGWDKSIIWSRNASQYVNLIEPVKAEPVDLI